MSARILDDRTFETAVDQSPEEQAANAAYFADKGYAVTTEEVDESGNKVSTEPAGPAKTETDEVPVVDGTPVEADILAEHAEIATKNDGERLGYNARRTRKIKELEEGLASEKAKREQLEKLLEAKPAAEAKSSAFQPPPPPAPVTAPVQAGPAAAAPPVEEIKPKEFDKPRPTRPTLEQFQDEADPYAALTAAGIDYAEKLYEWDKDKSKFERDQEVEVSKQTREVEAKKTKEKEYFTALSQRLDDVRKSHPDYDLVTQGSNATPILYFLLVGNKDTGLEPTLPDGIELAYQLHLPENAETLKELTKISEVPNGEDGRSVQNRIDMVRAELVAFRKDLKRKATAAPVTTEKPAEPVAAAPPPANGKPNGTTTQVSPSNGQPRREEASPTPVKGRGVTPSTRLEDVDPEDYDARKALRRQQGLH